jgi:hypothetical protein
MLDKRTKQIWRGLVDYANTDLESNTYALKNLAGTLFESMPWMARNPLGLPDYAKAASLESDRNAMKDFAADLAGSICIPTHIEVNARGPFGFTDVPEMIASQINPDALQKINQAKKQATRSRCKTEKELADQFRQQAVKYQLQLRRLLTWLSDPKRNAKDRTLAFEFLSEHTRHIVFERGDPAFGPEEEQSRYFTEEGNLRDDFPHRTRFYKDIADPICDFIQGEHELGRDAPIQICKRPGCGNLVVCFKKKEYCRTSLCDKERQKRDDNLKQKKNRDNVFLYRLRRLPFATRRKRVRASIDRLREIESYWRHKNQSLAKHALELLNNGIDRPI